MALFGPLVRAEAHCDSDADILIDIAPQAHFSLIDLMDIKLCLEDKLDRDVDLVTREGLDPKLRDSILAEAEAVFL